MQIWIGDVPARAPVRKSLPRNLEAEVEELLADQPSVSWDQAVAAIAERNLKR